MKIKPNKTLKRVGWSRTPLIAFALAVGLAMGSCGAIHNLPPQTSTTVEVKDSTIIHIIDSVRVVEKTVQKDLTWLGDTLKLKGNRSRAWAYADTTKKAIIGGLEEDKIEEKTKTVFKERLVEVHDTLRIQEPVEVIKEVEVKVVPWYHKILSGLGLIALIFLGIKLFLFLKK